jgi:hypothetical protein
MIRPTASIAFALACACAAAPVVAQQARFPASAVPARGTRLPQFVPRGWRIARQAEGDLNGDGRPDHVLHLVESGSGYDPDAVMAAPEVHALVIVLTDGAALRRGGVATGLLQGGVPQWGLQMNIRRGVLNVEQNFGMTEVSDFTHRFRLDPATGRFLLIGCDRLFYTRPQEASDSRKVSENYLTDVRLTTEGHESTGDFDHARVKRETIPRTRVFFEDVNEASDT